MLSRATCGAYSLQMKKLICKDLTEPNNELSGFA